MSKNTALILLAAFLGFGVVALWLKRPTSLKDRCERHLSVVDGSHRHINQRIKAGLRDPESFQHIETTYQMPEGSAATEAFYTVRFRAKNGFGGYVAQTAFARCRLETGEVVAFRLASD
jgi:hypothetical protein